MPEGDTVYQAARRLDAALVGRALESSKFRLQGYGSLDLTGCKVGSVVSRGKHLLIRAGGLSIHSRMTLAGRWDVYATGERSRVPASRADLVLRNNAFQAVGFALEYLEVIRTTDEPRAVGHLGPDPLGHSWDPAEAARRLASDPARPIGLALLDQRLIAGLGNVYRSEILFLARTNPRTPAGEVQDMAKIVDLAHKLLHANKDRVRRSTAPASLGAPYSVYARAGLPCPRCEDPVVHETFDASAPDGSAAIGGQDLYWCPQCQPLPSDEAGGVLSASAVPGTAGRLP